MRFFMQFSRWKGAGGPILGSDSAPTSAPPTPPTAPVSAPSDITLTSSMIGAGWPLHRVAITLHAPALATAITGQLYFWEDLTQRWYATPAAVTITPEKVVYVDMLALIDRAPTRDSLDSPGSGSLSVMLVVQAGGTVDGEYIFAMAPVLSTV